MAAFSYNGSNYELVTQAKTWIEAKAYAESIDGYLAIVGSDAENAAILAEALKVFANAPSADDGGGAKYLWLGASDLISEGTFKWVDNTNVSAGFKKWGSGSGVTEPDDSPGGPSGDQDALGMGLEAWPLGGGIGTLGEWNDIDAANAMFFVVEFNTTTLNSGITASLPASYLRLNLTGSLKINGTGNALDNALTGNAAANKLFGLAGNDTLDGGLGADTLAGGPGDDRYLVDDAKDAVNEKANEGNDTVIATVSHTLASNVENLTLAGAATINATGNKTDNALIGNDAKNLLNGGLGNDTLTGGLGNDVFVFNTAIGFTNVDRLTDFTSGSDAIQLSKTIFKAFKLVGGIASSAFYSANGAVAASDAEDRLIYNSSNGDVYYDADGIGTKSQPIKIAIVGLESPPNLTYADFSII